MADSALLAAGGGNAPLNYLVPGATSIRIKQIHVSYTDNGASGDWLPAVKIVSDSKHLMGTAADQAVKVTLGSDADVSFFPRVRRRAAATGPVLDYNLGEIGRHIATTLGTTSTAPVSFQDVAAGDGIMVLSMAPSLPSVAAPEGIPASVADTKGNTYGPMWYSQFEALPATVNEGVTVQLWWCPASVTRLVAGVDAVTATWDNQVYDRVIAVWSVRHSGGANFPTVLAATADNDAAVFASGQVTLTSPLFTPARDKALEFALVISAKAGGVGGFGGVAGWSGFFQAEFRNYSGSKQSYLVNPQTHGADAYLIAGAVPANYEDDVGVLPGGVNVPAFNGVAQAYSAGANAWKGIILMSLD